MNCSFKLVGWVIEIRYDDNFTSINARIGARRQIGSCLQGSYFLRDCYDKEIVERNSLSFR